MERKSPQFGARLLKAIRHNEKLAQEGYFRSGKRITEEDWYHDTIEGFGICFYETIPTEERDTGNLKSFPKDSPLYIIQSEIFLDNILRTLEKNERRTAVELGGQGILFQAFPKGFLERTAGVCLKDTRTEGERRGEENRGHYVIEDDIMDTVNPNLLEKIKQVLGTEKVDLVVCRMKGPLNYLDRHPAILDRLVRVWYELLPENGLMFAQFVYKRDSFEDERLIKLVQEWAKLVGAKYPEIRVTVGNVRLDNAAIRIHKKPGAPEKLPPATQLFGQKTLKLR